MGGERVAALRSTDSLLFLSETFDKARFLVEFYS